VFTAMTCCLGFLTIIKLSCMTTGGPVSTTIAAAIKGRSVLSFSLTLFHFRLTLGLLVNLESRFDRRSRIRTTSHCNGSYQSV
jgi:hypothetical protein